MNEAVLDTSAVLALLLGEAGADRVAAVLPHALISTVNLAETVSKLCERGTLVKAARLAVAALGAEVVDFDLEQACLTGELRTRTRAAGLSLGDRACIALAQIHNLPVMTADAAWARIHGLHVVLIRGTAQ